jgi:hypothetical protein
MTVINELQTLQSTISALKAIIEANGCEIEDTDGLTELTTILNSKFNNINNRLIGVTGTNKGKVNREGEYLQDLEDIKQVLTDYGVTPPASYDDLDDTIAGSYNAIYEVLNGIVGDVPVDTSQTAQIEALTAQLDDIKEVLIELGIDVTDDYSDLPDIIRSTYEDITSQLEEINQGT